ncbi:hypothetical protein BH09BAC5_BH09BAC5_25540 [soil metagenome]
MLFTIPYALKIGRLDIQRCEILQIKRWAEMRHLVTIASTAFHNGSFGTGAMIVTGSFFTG